MSLASVDLNVSELPDADRPVVLWTVLGIAALALFLESAFDSRHALLFLIGGGLGYTLFHAAFGFTGGWRLFIRERRGRWVRAHLLLLTLVTLLFFPVLGHLFGDLGVQPAQAPLGISLLVGALIFGVGMQLGGACGSGTLYTVGQGQMDMLITIGFFIVGATIASAHLHWWQSLPALKPISLIEHFGWRPAMALQILVLFALYLLVSRLERRRYGELAPLTTDTQRANLTDRIIFGPWPLWAGAIIIALLALATLLLAGHPWSITFAFSLWGAKLWSAIGGDVSHWPYWSGGYPARALGQSVLADITSVMDFGLILGSMLAAALAARFVPPQRLTRNRVAAAVIGGLLLGYGARLAFGCNIGAMLAGISSGSLHGWVWLATAFCGAFLGARLRVWLGLDRSTGKNS